MKINYYRSLKGLTTGIILSLLSLSAPVRAGQPHSLLALHTGLAHYTGNRPGIASETSGWRTGLAWQGNYTYLFGREEHIRFGLGLLYQGTRYQGDSPHATDRIRTHYLAPELSLHFPAHRWDTHIALGFGYQWYRNQGSVYEQPRCVTIDRHTPHLAAGGNYRLSPKWGLSARLMYISTPSSSYEVTYHGQSWKVRPDQFDHLSQLSLTAGVYYRF